MRTYITSREEAAALDRGEQTQIVIPCPALEMPPMLPGESHGDYTDRLTGADGTDRIPYKEHRFRQCSIGWHDECSDPAGEECQCPCHTPPFQPGDKIAVHRDEDNKRCVYHGLHLVCRSVDCRQIDGKWSWIVEVERYKRWVTGKKR